MLKVRKISIYGQGSFTPKISCSTDQCEWVYVIKRRNYHNIKWVHIYWDYNRINISIIQVKFWFIFGKDRGIRIIPRWHILILTLYRIIFYFGIIWFKNQEFVSRTQFIHRTLGWCERRSHTNASTSYQEWY